jgi:hypothetical protein
VGGTREVVGARSASSPNAKQAWNWERRWEQQPRKAKGLDKLRGRGSFATGQ